MLMLQLFCCAGPLRLFRRVPGCLLVSTRSGLPATATLPTRAAPGSFRAAAAPLRTKIIANCIFYASHDNFMQKLGLTASEPRPIIVNARKNSLHDNLCKIITVISNKFLIFIVSTLNIRIYDNLFTFLPLRPGARSQVLICV